MRSETFYYYHTVPTSEFAACLPYHVVQWRSCFLYVATRLSRADLRCLYFMRHMSNSVYKSASACWLQYVAEILHAPRVRCSAYNKYDRCARRGQLSIEWLNTSYGARVCTQICTYLFYQIWLIILMPVHFNVTLLCRSPRS